MALPTCAVSMIMYGAMALGRMCWTMTRRHEAPTEVAASTYGFSLTDRAADRPIRAARGMIGMVMAITTFWTAGPRIDAMASARISNGNASRVRQTDCPVAQALEPSERHSSPYLGAQGYREGADDGQITDRWGSRFDFGPGSDCQR